MRSVKNDEDQNLTTYCNLLYNTRQHSYYYEKSADITTPLTPVFVNLRIMEDLRSI